MRTFTLIFCILAPLMASGHGKHRVTEPIQPLEEPKTLSEAEKAKVNLGKKLFEDTILSKNNSVSCASCHNLKKYGVDGLVHSVGVNGSLGEINSPSIMNSRYNFVQFWNGRAKNLEQQIDGPVQHPKELGSNWPEILEKLKQHRDYQALFKKSYADGISEKNVKNAIAQFEKQLVTVNSRFDRYLHGDKEALSEREIQGYKKFMNFGCISCHQGQNIGGNMFQTMGVMGDYFRDRKTPITETDLGRYQVTKQEKDRHVFRVPSLRNVAETAPYFHDGSAETLEEAVKVMARYQLGKKLSKEETNLIVDFLKTLTGELPTVVSNSTGATP